MTSSAQDKYFSSIADVAGFNANLKQNKEQFSQWVNARNTPVHIVMGNEASDLDSIVCSTVLAYYISSAGKGDAVALINIPREDFKLRTETSWLFQKLGIKVEDLLFVPEVQKEVDALHSTKRLNLVLVDHNRLAVSQEKYDNDVVEIVDHHKDEKRCPNAKDDKRVVELVGSCATLVAEKLLKGNKSILTKTIARLLLGPILLDTVNLDPKYEKVTKKDEAVASDLFKIAALDNKQLFFEKLQEERFSVDSLDTYDLLRADYKQWTMGKWEVGVGSAKIGLKDWIKKDKNLTKEFEKYLQSRKLDILYAMTQYLDNQKNIHRELIVFTPNKELLQESRKFLEASDLQLAEVEKQTAAALSTNAHHLVFYDQANVAASRKQLQPLLVQHYEKK